MGLRFCIVVISMCECVRSGLCVFACKCVYAFVGGVNGLNCFVVVKLKNVFKDVTLRNVGEEKEKRWSERETEGSNDLKKAVSSYEKSFTLELHDS